MGIKKKKSIIKGNRLFYIVIFSVILYVAWIFGNQQIKLQTFQQQEQEKQKQVAALKQEVLRIEEEIKQSNTPEFIEKVAREQLKMVKPNEIIYIDMEKAKHP